MEDLDLSAISLSSEHDIDVAIISLAQSYERLGRQLLNLRSHRNNCVPAISRLPNEILTEIIVTFVRLCRQQSTEHGYLKWLWITHVCGRWRSIALGMSCLWTTIVTGRHLACVETFLQRSKDLPLSITPGQVEHKEKLDPRFFAPLIHTGAVARLQNLKLYLIMNTMMGLLDDSYLSPDYTSEPDSAPILETLTLRYVSFPNSGNPPPHFWFLSYCAMPKLRELCLRHLPVDLTTNLVCPALTKLSVSPTISMDVLPWLILLRKLPLLQTLELDGVKSDTGLPAVLASAARMVTLCHLREVKLCYGGDRGGDGMGCTQLLNHLTIPSDCVIYLHADSRSSHFAFAAVASKKNGAGCLGPPEHFTSMHVVRDRVQLWVKGQPECLVRENLRPACLPTNRPVVEILGVSIRTIDSTTFPLPGLQLLCLRATKPAPVFLSGLSSSFDLHELHHHRSMYMEDTLNALAGVNADLRSAVLPSVAHDSPRTLLPRLRSVTLDAAKWHLHPGTCHVQPFAGEPFSTVIDTFLSARRGMGVPIDELHLPNIRHLNEAQDMKWLDRMSTEYSAFSWTRWPGKDTWGGTRCRLCDDTCGSFRFPDPYEQ